MIDHSLMIIKEELGKLLLLEGTTERVISLSQKVDEIIVLLQKDKLIELDKESGVDRFR